MPTKMLAVSDPEPYDPCFSYSPSPHRLLLLPLLRSLPLLLLFPLYSRERAGILCSFSPISDHLGCTLCLLPSPTSPLLMY